MSRWAHRDSRNYVGIGTQKTTGRKTFPGALWQLDKEEPFHVTIGSNEMEGDTLLFLSLQEQAELGLAKDATDGSIWSKCLNGYIETAR